MNRVLSSALKNKSPYYMIFKEDPDIHTLKVFCTLTYASTLQSHKTKLDHIGRKCIFLGLKQGAKGVILLDMNNQDIFISRNVVHYEHNFPYVPNWKYHTCPNSEKPQEEISPIFHNPSQHDAIPCEEQNSTNFNHDNSHVPNDYEYDTSYPEPNNHDIDTSLIHNESNTTIEPESSQRPTRNRNP